MATLIIVVGLPGSGKSTLLREMVARGEVGDGFVRHDFHAESKDNSHDIDQSRFFDTAIAALNVGTTCAIADIWFCKPGHVEHTSAVMKSRVSGLSIDVRYFENAPDACIANVLHDGGMLVRERVARIRELTQVYAPPADLRPLIPVYRARA